MKMKLIFSGLVMMPHQAAQTIMNTFYQNCEAAAQAPYDVEKLGDLRGYVSLRNDVTKGTNSRVQDLAVARDSQYYVKCDGRQRPRKNCRDLCGAPPTYLWGGMGTYQKTKKGITLDVFHNTEPTQTLAGHPGLDCSGFIHTVFALAGLRVRPDQAPSAETADSITARTFMNQPGGCFKDTSLDQIRPGDLIAWTTHIVMVDSVGEDPFGLKAVSKIEDCTFENLKPDRFGLVVINSKGGTDSISDEVKALDAKNPALKRKLQAVEAKKTGVGIGISKLRWADLAAVSPNSVMELALAACFAKFGKDLPPGKSLNQKPWRETINVVRHRLTEGDADIDPADPCLARKDETISLVGFECVKTCRIP